MGNPSLYVQCVLGFIQIDPYALISVKGSMTIRDMIAKRETRGPTYRLLIFVSGLISILSACAPQLVREPNLGALESYQVVQSFDGLRIGFEVPEGKAFANELSFRALRYIGVLIVNMKLVNAGKTAVILRREDIVLSFGPGNTFVPLDQRGLIAVTSGIFGIQFFPNILERFTDWALPATSIVAINQSVTGYLYFQVGTAYEAAKVGTVRFTASPARILRTFEQEIKLGVGK